MIVNRRDSAFIPVDPALEVGKDRKVHVRIAEKRFDLTVRELLGMQCLTGDDEPVFHKGVGFIRFSGQTILTIDARDPARRPEKGGMVVVANVTVDGKKLPMTIGFMGMQSDALYALLGSAEGGRPG